MCCWQIKNDIGLYVVYYYAVIITVVLFNPLPQLIKLTPVKFYNCLGRYCSYAVSITSPSISQLPFNVICLNHPHLGYLPSIILGIFAYIWCFFFFFQSMPSLECFLLAHDFFSLLTHRGVVLPPLFLPCLFPLIFLNPKPGNHGHDYPIVPCPGFRPLSNQSGTMSCRFTQQG